MTLNCCIDRDAWRSRSGHHPRNLKRRPTSENWLGDHPKRTGGRPSQELAGADRRKPSGKKTKKTKATNLSNWHGVHRSNRGSFTWTPLEVQLKEAYDNEEKWSVDCVSMYLLRCCRWNSVSTALLMRVRHSIVSYTHAIVARLYEASEGDENTSLRRGFAGPPACALQHEKTKKT